MPCLYPVGPLTSSLAAQDEANSAGAICQLSGLWRDHSLHNMPAAVHARGVWHHVGRGEPSTPSAPLQPMHLGTLCLRFYVGYVQTCASGVMLQNAVVIRSYYHV